MANNFLEGNGFKLRCKLICSQENKKYVNGQRWQNLVYCLTNDFPEGNGFKLRCKLICSKENEKI